MRLPGYMQLGRHYVSKAFLYKTLIMIFVFGMLYTIMLHPLVMRLWYSYQSFPTFSINSPYLAEYSGRARLLHTDGATLYEGQIENTLINGYGKLYENGVLLYAGNFSSNKFNGWGTLYNADGSIKYEGEFEENIYQGTGTMYDGKNVYTGGFVSGQFNGNGKLYENDSLLYEGGFIDGQFNGDGKLYKNDSLLYEGGFIDGLFNGDGKSYDHDRLVYIGGFAGGLYTGNGKLFNSEGLLLYDGAFFNGLFEGVGKLLQNGALVYEGEWALGLYNGAGAEYNPNTGHLVFQGRYLAGERMDEGIYYDEKGAPVIETNPNNDDTKNDIAAYEPKYMLGLAYEEVIATLEANGIDYIEQPLDDSHLIMSTIDVIIYSFPLFADKETGSLDTIYYCGMSSVGGLTVGTEVIISTQAAFYNPSQMDLFALYISDTYWGRETNADSLREIELQNAGYGLTVVYDPTAENSGRIIYIKEWLVEAVEISK